MRHTGPSQGISVVQFQVVQIKHRDLTDSLHSTALQLIQTVAMLHRGRGWDWGQEQLAKITTD